VPRPAKPARQTDTPDYHLRVLRERLNERSVTGLGVPRMPHWLRQPRQSVRA